MNAQTTEFIWCSYGKHHVHQDQWGGTQNYCRACFREYQAKRRAIARTRVSSVCSNRLKDCLDPDPHVHCRVCTIILPLGENYCVDCEREMEVAS